MITIKTIVLWNAVRGYHSMLSLFPWISTTEVKSANVARLIEPQKPHLWSIHLIEINRNYPIMEQCHLCKKVTNRLKMHYVVIFFLHSLAVSKQHLTLHISSTVCLSYMLPWFPDAPSALNLTKDCTNHEVRKWCLHICKSGLEANLVAGWLNRAARLPPVLSPLALSGGER